MASYTFLNYRKHYKISNKIYLAVALGEKLGTDIYLHIFIKVVSTGPCQQSHSSPIMPKWSSPKGDGDRRDTDSGRAAPAQAHGAAPRARPAQPTCCTLHTPAPLY